MHSNGKATPKATRGEVEEFVYLLKKKEVSQRVAGHLSFLTEYYRLHWQQAATRVPQQPRPPPQPHDLADPIFKFKRRAEMCCFAAALVIITSCRVISQQ